MNGNVVYRDGIAPTVEGVRQMLTPRVHERLKSEAGYDDALAKREYPQATFDAVVKCACNLAGIRDFDAFNRIYAEFLAGSRSTRWPAWDRPGGLSYSTPYLA